MLPLLASDPFAVKVGVEEQIELVIADGQFMGGLVNVVRPDNREWRRHLRHGLLLWRLGAGLGLPSDIWPKKLVIQFPVIMVRFPLS